MADRTRKTRQKMTTRATTRVTFRVAAPKPRNPLVAPSMKRVAGPHRKSASATRAAERRAAHKAMNDKDDDDR